ncbi:MAG TPA: hypothetical protein PLW31_15020 [Bacteroidales bacterium]|nr:hypothetical protein [Bacteroidales bacterium]
MAKISIQPGFSIIVPYKADDNTGNVRKGRVEDNDIIIVNNFDKKGIKTEQSYYNTSGELIEQVVCKPDDSGKLAEKICLYGIENPDIKPDPHCSNLDSGREGTDSFENYTFFPASDQKVCLTSYKYDKKGRLIEEYRYSDNRKLINKVVITYNDRGEVQEYIQSDHLGYPDFTNKYRYDDDHRLVEVEEFNSVDELACKTVNTYDDQGNLTEKRLYDERGELSKKIKQEYDDSGNLVLQEEYDRGTLLMKTTRYRYNVKKILFEKILDGFSMGGTYRYLYTLGAGNASTETVVFKNDKAYKMYEIQYGLSAGEVKQKLAAFKSLGPVNVMHDLRDEWEENKMFIINRFGKEAYQNFLEPYSIVQIELNRLFSKKSIPTTYDDLKKFIETNQEIRRISDYNAPHQLDHFSRVLKVPKWKLKLGMWAGSDEMDYKEAMRSGRLLIWLNALEFYEARF